MTSRLVEFYLLKRNGVGWGCDLYSISSFERRYSNDLGLVISISSVTLIVHLPEEDAQNSVCFVEVHRLD